MTTLPTPVTTVLRVLSHHAVRTMMMGGQACIVYGASEFSRDLDLAILSAPDNLARLRRALDELGAVPIAVPPFEASFLERGHAVHFRCVAADGFRLDVMARMRGVPPFDECWTRRSVLTLPDIGDVDVLGLEDLVRAKKTRRDKDWPVVRRLVDVHYRGFGDAPTEARIAFWMRELRTPETLVDCVARFEARGDAPPREAAQVARQVVAGDATMRDVADAITREEARERAADEAYWRPLLDELARLRHERRRDGPSAPGRHGG